MATVVLTAVGAVVGGPVGAAIGSVIGGAIDRAATAPKRREGPRLAELAIQTSSYGTQVPLLFGRMRVAGTVIWATDLVERRSKDGGGKGRPGTTYAYSANFAVLLSARAVIGVARIWADGKLLRGAGGDWKVPTGFRLHLGGESQAVDPLIGSAEGATPAYRGCAYAVFEGLELAEFGNRIPSLTFEVTADAGPVAVDAVARALAGEIDADCPVTLGGFAAAGGSVRAVLETLAVAGGASFAAGGGRVAMRAVPAGEAVIEDAGAAAGEARGPVRARALRPADTVPVTVAVSHYDPARDYQAGLQRAGRPGAGGRSERVEMPAAIDAGAAKTLATAVLQRAEGERVRRTVTLGPGGLALAPGDGVRIAGENGRWRVAATTTERMVTTVELVPTRPGTLPVAASAGRVLGAPDRVAGTTVLHAFEGPPDVGGAGPRLMIAAAGGAGWRSASLLWSADDGASWTPVTTGVTTGATPATIGTVEGALAPGSAALRDDGRSVTVMLRAHMALRDADDAALDGGANLALLGEELIQFGRAEPLGNGRWRLSRLLRGRRGSAATGAVVGERFVLAEADTLHPVELPAGTIGREVRVMASGVGDTAAPVEARTVVAGRSVLPLSPVRVRFEPMADGRVVVRWTRRSRAGWDWIDGAEAPLGEEVELYAATVTRADGSARMVTAGVPELLVEAGERGGPVEVSVRQRGVWGMSRAAMVVVPGL